MNTPYKTFQMLNRNHMTLFNDVVTYGVVFACSIGAILHIFKLTIYLYVCYSYRSIRVMEMGLNLRQMPKNGKFPTSIRHQPILPENANADLRLLVPGGSCPLLQYTSRPSIFGVAYPG